MSTPPIEILSATKEGTLRYSEPKMMNSACSTASETASVIISTASCDWRSGRTRNRSITTPKRATTSTAIGAARNSGTLSSEVRT